MKKSVLSLILAALLSGTAFAQVQNKTIEYKIGKTVFEGYLAYDDAVKPGSLQPGVLVVHEWMGLNDFSRKRADQLAQMGYVAFAVDMYGKGIRAKDMAEAGKLSGAVKADRKLMRDRMQAALDVLKSQKNVDEKRIASIGFCFGGTCSLELARAGSGISGVVSFHGGLSTPNPENTQELKAKVLVLHGADDPYVPALEVSTFEEEMRKAKADWQLVKYSGAVHSFTNPDAGNDNSKGAAYNEKAAQRSWEAMKVFFNEIFK